jgi:hypothetical protein
MKYWRVSVADDRGFSREWVEYEVYADTSNDARVAAHMWHNTKVTGYAGTQMSPNHFASVCEETLEPVEIMTLEEQLKRAQQKLDPYRADSIGSRLFGVDLSQFTHADLMAALVMTEKKNSAPF